MSAVLVVCTGNVCRSPMAEGFLRAAFVRRLGDAAPRVSSAGTAGWDGSGATPEAVDAAAERGVDIREHVARKLDTSMIDGAAVIVCMAAEQRDAVGRLAPAAAERTFTLKELTGLLEARGTPAGADDLARRVADAAALRGSGGPERPADEDVVDPLGAPPSVYRAVAWELDTFSQRLVRAAFGRTDDVAAGREGR